MFSEKPELFRFILEKVVANAAYDKYFAGLTVAEEAHWTQLSCRYSKDQKMISKLNMVELKPLTKRNSIQKLY